MRAMRLFEYSDVSKNPLQLDDPKIPIPGTNQILVRVITCGSCHTDIHTVEGDIKPQHLPITPGHQVVGVVDQMGAGVVDWSIGERIGIPWLYSTCGHCDYCVRGMENLCEKARFTGFSVDGGYAETMLVSAENGLRLPAGLSAEEISPLLCAGIIGYRSLLKAELSPGKRIGLVGFGASAHIAIQIANHWGCDVYVITRSLQHRKHAEQLGASWVGGMVDKLPNLLDSAIIFAPVGALVPAMLGKIKRGGTLVLNAIHMSEIPGMDYQLIYGERTLRSVANATYQDGVDLLNLAVEIPIETTIQLYDLENVNQALNDIKQSKLNGEAVIHIQDE